LTTLGFFSVRIENYQTLRIIRHPLPQSTPIDPEENFAFWIRDGQTVNARTSCMEGGLWFKFRLTQCC